MILSLCSYFFKKGPTTVIYKICVTGKLEIFAGSKSLVECLLVRNLV